MNRISALTWLAIFWLNLASTNNVFSQPNGSPYNSLRPWLNDLEAGHRQSLANGRPIFVRIGGEACPWCKKLDEEITKPAVQAELTRWTLVYLGTEKSIDQIRQLAVGPIPAMRLLTPRGRIVESHDGYIDAEKLVDWLKENYDGVKGPANENLLSVGEPNLIEVVRLVRLFDERNATVREAVSQRLLPYPKLACEQVVTSFCEGSLATKLTALELLTEWKAPVEGLDPWRSETISPDRLVELKQWSKEFIKLPNHAVDPLTESKLADVRIEIDRMVRADSTEVEAIRERLSRLGEQLLPEVYDRLKSEENDEIRGRLLALRYRLTAKAQLVLRWSGGLERLASSNVKVRHAAADELSKISTAEEQRLLLELFSDSDPFVREISLKGLKNIGGRHATAALVKLLGDPDLNVRAAVLKQLAEDAPPEMVEDVGKYVDQETDSDLLVHAIRYFRETQSPEIVEHLLPLLEHESWQVRAEAVEAIAQKIDRYDFLESTPNAGKISDKMIEMLADPDSFVVAKALEAVQEIDLEGAVEPLVAAAKKHPSLTRQVVSSLSSGSNMSKAAIPHLKLFFESENPSVRAAAIRGLCKVTPAEVEKYLITAAHDDDSQVRIAAAESFLGMMDELRPDDDELAKQQVRRLARTDELTTEEGIDKSGDPSPINKKLFRVLVRAANKTLGAEGNSDEKTLHPWDRWLTELYDGKHRTKWTNQLIAPFEAMLESEISDERIAASLALIPLGQRNQAIDKLLEAAAEGDDQFYSANSALKWLTWDDRQLCFKGLDRLAQKSDHLISLAYALRHVTDNRSAELYWRLLSREDATLGVAEAARYGMRQLFYGSRYYDRDSITNRTRRAVAEEVKPRARTGPSLQRLVALNFLMSSDPVEATQIATELLTDTTVDDSLRTDAFQVMLIAQTKRQRRETVFSALRAGDEEKLKVALAFLALGEGSLTTLRGSGFEIEIESDSFSVSYGSSSGVPIIPDPPRGLVHADVETLLNHDDIEVAAYAGYLVTLFGDPAGMPPLIRLWHRQEEPDETLDRLVYRAVASLDLPQHISYLREIYYRRDHIRISDFYWTIRIMSGSEILQFRKQIRSEVDADELR